MVGTIIVAVSPEGVIGVDNRIPWRHPGDMKRFKRLTIGGTVIMGRNTWESLPKRPLPERRNIVITRDSGVPDSFRTLEDALRTVSGEVWFIGGAAIYAEAMQHADKLDVTYVPENIRDPRAIYFPEIDPLIWEAGPLLEHEDAPGLRRREYLRRR